MHDGRLVPRSHIVLAQCHLGLGLGLGLTLGCALGLGSALALGVELPSGDASTRALLHSNPNPRPSS